MVVEHEDVVVVVTMVVTVVAVAEPEVVVVEAEPEDVVDAEVVELTEELAEVGVQPGRVNVPL